MPQDPLGISFAPDSGSQQNSQKPTPVQQAIQTLSLRIPRVVGAGSLAPQGLLTAPGGGGLSGNPNAAAFLEELRRRLFGGGGQFPTASPPITAPSGPKTVDPGSSQPQPGSGQPAMPFPAPTVTPGDDGPKVVDEPPAAPTAAPPLPQPPGLGPGVGPQGPRQRWV